MRKSSGFILVSVMIASATLLTAATAFAWFARTEARAEAARERIYRFRNAAQIAVNIMSRRIAEDRNGYDGPTESLYDPYEHVKLEIGDYTAEVQVRPLNDKIPISGLLLPDGVTPRSEYETAWENVWEALELPRLAWEVVDFIDADTDQRLGGAERDTNINRMISDLSELRAMPEITDGVLWGTDEIPGGLARYVTVVGGEKINVNVAAPEVLAVLDDALTPSHARSIAAYRLVNPIKDMEGLRNVPGFPASLTTKLANIIGFESTHFLLSVKVSDGAGNVRNYRVVVERGGSGAYSWEE
ncbi:general secretion pathway protein GspK [uncultured Cloacibacillus sp.]|uniref:general secretion pathway protein GspK n=1 Tax=uncultured Cloacibacillus sp. TaxID=889794 RepID=UPI0026DBEEF1|nr:type II secretion system protein GspK [uncultured Cloacibacillus sp.]